VQHRLNLARALRATGLACMATALPFVTPTPALATTFNYDFGATCTSVTVSGRTIVCNDGQRIALDSSVTPGCPQFAIARGDTSFTLVCATPNATGLWWKPDEDGRGTWLSHQGDTIFAVDYAYDSGNLPRWRTLIATKQPSGTFAGDVYETSGPSFSAPGFDVQAVRANKIGPGWIAQDDADHVRVNMSEGIARPLTRQAFGTVPKCAFGLASDATTDVNFTDLWWNSSESGWGINLAHQGNTIFAAWYTYTTSGAPLFLVSTLYETATGSATFEGDLYRATGPAGPTLSAAKVGTAQLSFTNGNSATLTTTAQIDGMSAAMTRTANIARQVFAAPGASCQ
jgi:hypothetical protein